jgi:polyribonucleotide 5'-hydroxyl-kinase
MGIINTDDLPAPATGAERHVLQAEEELRLEVNFSKTANLQLTLLQGSAELQGVELALNQTYNLGLDSGGLKVAIFTWHGCCVDVVSDDVEIAYTSDETNSNVAAVNTHAQLEALRDAADDEEGGPRVMIVGPQESGKTSLAKLLIAYAVKLGRTPILVDLDPADNCLTVPGTLSANVMSSESVSVETYSTTGLPVSQQPLVLWHGSTVASPDLFRAQVTALGGKLDRRIHNDEWVRRSGLIVNTNGWIQDEGFQLLLHSVAALKISVVLVMGHDRLYSMMKSAVGKTKTAAATTTKTSNAIKVIKVPRSGGVVSRESAFMNQCRSRSIKRYFYGSVVESATASHRVPQLTPFAVQVAFSKLIVYKFAAMSLSASLLPVAAAQSTESVQLQTVEITEKLQHCLLAVCHPHAVAAYGVSGSANDLYESGVAGFCVVEKVLMETDMIHLLSPCAGSLPSSTLILGEITWME